MQSLLAELRCSALELMKQRMRAAFFRAENMFSKGWEVLPVEQMEAETRQAVEVSTVFAQERAGGACEAAGPKQGLAGAGEGA